MEFYRVHTVLYCTGIVPYFTFPQTFTPVFRIRRVRECDRQNPDTYNFITNSQTPLTTLKFLPFFTITYKITIRTGTQ